MTIPDYTLRYSKKAKHLQLRMSNKGLEVIVPVKKHISTSVLHDFIIQKKDWIAKVQQKYLNSHESTTIAKLPERIDLQAINQIWTVGYLTTKHKRVSLYTNPSRQIKLVGNMANEPDCIELLKQWLKQMAESHLCEMLRSISNEVGIPFHQATIRNNTTRWGSCTSKKNISLCCRLLFLPAYLVRHVILHELCHTKIMHHGKAFWDLLTKLDPNTDIHDKALKKGAKLIPRWII